MTGSIALTQNGKLANPLELYLDPEKFEHVWRIAQALAKSDLVPDHFKRKPENCFIACQMAFRTGVDPMAFLQKSYVIAGKAAIETQLAIAMVNSSGLLTGSIRYKHDGKGKDRACTAYCVEKSTGEVLQHTLHWHTVEAEGWVAKKGSKWVTDPLLMLEYRSAMRLIRTHFPEVLLGMLTKEEAEEVATVDAVSVRQSSVSRVTHADDQDGSTLAERLQAKLGGPVEAAPDVEQQAQAADGPLTQDDLDFAAADEQALAINREDN